MPDKKIVARLLLLLMLVYSFTGTSQTIRRKHARLDEHPPKEILVELSTQTNRITYLEKIKKHSLATEVKGDADSVIKKMVADFNDHFTYCPVYFFYDTTAEQVKGRNFAGNLLDKHLQPIQGNVINAEDTSYFVIYYGIEAQNATASAKQQTDIYSGTYTSNNVPALVAMDYKFNQLQNPLPYKVKMSTVKHRDLLKKQLAPYKYESKRYDISYQPLALFYNETLKTFYDPLKVIRKYRKS